MAAPMITLAEVAVHVRVSADPATPPGEPYASLLDDMIDAGKAIIAEYCPDAPLAVADIALVQIVGYYLDRPTSWRLLHYADVFRNSGCQSTLATWHSPVGVKI